MNPETQLPSPAPQPPTGAVDAVLIEPGVLRGGKFAARVHAALDLAEPLLGGTAYVREVGGGRHLATPGPTDRLYFDHDHPLSGQPRYTWAEGPAAGVRLGLLVEAARA